jgi:hypothetical protein
VCSLGPRLCGGAVCLEIAAAYSLFKPTSYLEDRLGSSLHLVVVGLTKFHRGQQQQRSLGIGAEVATGGGGGASIHEVCVFEGLLKKGRASSGKTVPASVIRHGERAM